MSDSSMMRWAPDREPNPRPIYGWDPRLDPSVVADVTFQDADDPEGARAWLDSQLQIISSGSEPLPEPQRLQSVPFPPENVRPPEGWRMTDPREDPRMRDDYWVRADDPPFAQGGLMPPPVNNPRIWERPNFPSDPLDDVAQIVIILRRESGLEETFEIEPSDVQFQMDVTHDWIEIGDPQPRLIPGRRELRRVLISIGSPRNWRRLATRRWR